MGSTDWSRREFLAAGAAGLTALALPWGRSGAAAADASSVDDALLLDLTPTSCVPRQCTFPRTVFARSRQRARQHLPLRATIVRPADALRLQVEAHGMVRQRTGAGACLFPDRSRFPLLVVSFPPQHVREHPLYCGSCVESNALGARLPVPGRLAQPSRLAFVVPPRVAIGGIPWDADALQRWDNYYLHVVKVALPEIGLDTDDFKEWRTRMERDLLTASPWPLMPPAEYAEYLDQLKHGNTKIPGWKPTRAPDDRQTVVWLPRDLALSPSAAVQWRVVPGTFRGDACKGVRPVWHCDMLPFGAAARRRREPVNLEPPVDPKALPKPFNRLDTVRAVWAEKGEDAGIVSDPQPCEVVEPIPTPKQRAELVLLSSTFQEDKYPAPPVLAERLQLSSVGALAKLHGVWNPSLVGLAEGKPCEGTSIDEWKQETIWGRDQKVLISLKGYVFPFGHYVSLVQLMQRESLEVDPGVGAAALRIRYVCKVRQPILHYEAGLEQLDWRVRRMPWEEVELLPLETPYLQCPATEEPDWFWMVPEGQQEPFRFTLRFRDRGKVVGTTEMPLLWVNCKLGSWPGDAKLDDAVREYCAHPSRRECDLRGKKTLFVPQPPSGDGTRGERDRSIETHVVRWGLELPARTKPAATEHCKDSQLTDEFFWCEGHAPCPTEAPFPPALRHLAFHPAVAFAMCRLDGVDAFCGTGAAPFSLAYDDAFVNSAFAPVGNSGEVYLRLYGGTAPTLKFPGPQSGGIVQPSMAITHVSRLIGPVCGDRPPPSALVDAKQASWKVTTKFSAGKFDPGEFFKTFPEVGSAKILGAFQLKDVVPVLASITSNLGRLPDFSIKELEGLGAGLPEIPAGLKALAELAESAKATVEGLVQAARDLRKAFCDALASGPGPWIDEYNELARAVGLAPMPSFPGCPQAKPHLPVPLSPIAVWRDEVRPAIVRLAKEGDALLERTERELGEWEALFAGAIVLDRSGLAVLAKGLGAVLDPLASEDITGPVRLLAELAHRAAALDVLGVGEVLRQLGEAISGLSKDPIQLRQEIKARLLRALTEGFSGVAGLFAPAERLRESFRDWVLRVRLLGDDLWALSTDLHVKVGAAFESAVQALEDAGEFVFGELESAVADAWLALEGALRTAVTTLIKALPEPLFVALAGLGARVRELEQRLADLLAAVPRRVRIAYDWKTPVKSWPEDAPLFKSGLKLSGKPYPAECLGLQESSSPEEHRGEFVLSAAVEASLAVGGGPVLQSRAMTRVLLRNFELHLIPNFEFVVVKFACLSFEGDSNGRAEAKPHLYGIDFKGVLQLIQEIGKLLGFASLKVFQSGNYLNIENRINPGLTSLGLITLENFNLLTRVGISFHGDPIRLTVGVADKRDRCFVGMGLLAGGGFLSMTLAGDQVEEMEMAIELGGQWNIVIGRIAVLAGIYYHRTSRVVALAGYVRGYGRVNLAIIQITIGFEVGIVSVTAECAGGGQSQRIVGYVLLYLEVKVLFFTVSIAVRFETELNNTGCERVLRGGPRFLFAPAAPVSDFASQRSTMLDAEWREHRALYAW